MLNPSKYCNTSHGVVGHIKTITTRIMEKPLAGPGFNELTDRHFVVQCGIRTVTESVNF